jgi:5-deoxy-D-glucuronate isomerase
MAGETATITAENTFTTAMGVNPGTRLAISINGLSDSTITVQRRLDGTNWRDVKNYTADVEETYIVDTKCDLRIGIKTGNYGTDTVIVRLG